MVRFRVFHVSEAAPLACDWGVFVPFVELDVLDGVAQTDFIDTGAASNIASDFNDGHRVDKFLSVRSVSDSRQLTNETIMVRFCQKRSKLT